MVTTIYDKSLFKRYFDANDTSAQAWADNVLAKLVAPGQVAKYVKRKDDEDSDTEFERLFGGLLPLLSYVVRLGRQFRDFKEDDFLADAYLNAQGHFTAGTESLAQLQALISDLLRVFAQRGTMAMITPNVDPDRPAGELLRLFGWDADTFFKLGLARPQYVGWNLNNCSPGYRGLTGRYDLNVGYESTEDVEDLDVYPLIDSGAVSLATYLDRQAMYIADVAPSSQAGIGGDTDEKGIVADPRLAMEITFLVAQPIPSETLTFGCRAFNAAGDEVQLVSAIDGSDESFFFERQQLNQADRFYFVRGIIYAKDTADLTSTQARLNVGFGAALRFVDDVVRIVPQIYVDNEEEDPASAYLWNVKVTPLATLYARTYLNNSKWVDVFGVNRNSKYSHDQLLDLMRRYFINYNTAFNVTFVDLLEAVVVANNMLLLETGDHLLLETGDHILLEV